MSTIPERCWKCDRFDIDTKVCSEASPPPAEERTAITATFSWGTPSHPNPHLTFDFHRDIHPDNVKQIALVMAQTAARKMDCMNLCAIEEESYGQPTGNA